MKHIFLAMEQLSRLVKGNFVYLFLDYDGTLVPIAENPQKALLGEKIRKTLAQLRDLSQRCKIAIISGRALNDLKKLVGLQEVIYVGNHGLEIESPKIKFKSQISAGYINLLQNLKNVLQARLAPFPGVIVEDKGLGLALHYRQARENDIADIKAVFQETAAAALREDKIRVKNAKMALEIRPPVKWDKGKSVLWLLARQHFALKEEAGIVPLYMGDDVTDEDAFKALKDKGITVKVGQEKDSYAKYYVKNTEEVFVLLNDIKKMIS